MAQQILEGTWEEVSQRSEELSGRRVRVTVLDDVTMPSPNEARTEGKGRAFGKYAHVPGTSEDFVREKQEEIDREDRRSR